MSFQRGADSRPRNQVSPGLTDTNFVKHAPDIKAIFGEKGDIVFGDSTVPFTANDSHTPNPPGPKEPPPHTPPDNLNVPGFPQFKTNYQLTAKDFPLNDWFRPTERTPRGPGVSFLTNSPASVVTPATISSQGVRHTLFTVSRPAMPRIIQAPMPRTFQPPPRQPRYGEQVRQAGRAMRRP